MNYRPDYYDVTTPATFGGDVEWYRQKAQASGGPVLELGAGTGRVTLAIAECGIPIHALDANRDMLDRLAAKLATASAEVRSRVTLVHDDMRSFALPERFALVICPFRAFFHNVTPDDRRACLERVQQHLRPGGRFAFNVFHPSLEYMAQNAGALKGVWRWVADFPLPDGGFLVRSDANQYDTVNQTVRSHLRYDEYAADGTLRRTFLQRLHLAYLYAADIRRMLSDAGFVHVTITGGFTERAPSHDTDELVIDASM